MKHEIHHKGTPVQAYRHPTPVEIRLAILAEFRNAPEVDGELPIPVRVLTLVEAGIQNACRAAVEASA